MARTASAEAPARARCSSCGGGLNFAAFERGERLCHVCVQFVDGPGDSFASAPSPGQIVHRPRRNRPEAVPEELIDELIASLQASEAATVAAMPSGPAKETVREVLRDIGVGESERELPWAAWGFAAGFCANVAVAKYAQVSSCLLYTSRCV